jgi:hypothetical protein
MKLGPEQERVLKELLGSTALQLQVHLGIPIKAGENFLAFVEAAVREIDVRGQYYVLSLDPNASGRKKLNQQEVQRRIQAETPILRVGLDGRLIEAREGKATHAASSSRTRNLAGFEVLVGGTYISYILEGYVVGEVDLTNPGVDPVSGPRFARRFAELDGLLSDHMNQRLARQQGLEYWSDRKGRILLSGPHGTEWIFHFELFWWLDKFVADALRVYAEPSGLGQDKTDINVVTTVGNYVIEVKWLGKNDNETAYDQKRINEGLIQVKLYLERDDTILRGYLVVYDGRPHADHISKSTHQPTCKHLRCEDPKILFLESETPSESAPTIARILSTSRK